MADANEIQLRKGVLELCVLAALSRGDSYAYEIAGRLPASIGIADGTIYPLMRRLQNDGLLTTYYVASSAGPSRKYYRLTPEGVCAFAAQRAAWTALSQAVDTILGEAA